MCVMVYHLDLDLLETQIPHIHAVGILVVVRLRSDRTYNILVDFDAFFNSKMPSLKYGSSDLDSTTTNGWLSECMEIVTTIHLNPNISQSSLKQ